MRFSICVTKTASKFHFISNLTEWHFSCRSKDNKFWLNKLGNLTQEEKQSLKIFAKILTKHSYGKTFIGKLFIVGEEKRVWDNIKKQLNKKEFKQTQKIFSVFNNKFDQLWETEVEQIEKWQTTLRARLNKREEIKKIINKSKVFFKTRNLPRNVKIFLLIGSGGGGANIGKGMITLDLASSSIPQNIKRAEGAVVHEVSHLIANSSSYYIKNINKFANLFSRVKHFGSKSIGNYTAFNEGIISAFCEGYVFTKYILKISDKKAIKQLENRITGGKNTLSKWRAFAAKEMFYVVENYFENKKTIDKKFFNILAIALEKFGNYLAK